MSGSSSDGECFTLLLFSVFVLFLLGVYALPSPEPKREFRRDLSAESATTAATQEESAEPDQVGSPAPSERSECEMQPERAASPTLSERSECEVQPERAASPTLSERSECEVQPERAASPALSDNNDSSASVGNNGSPPPATSQSEGAAAISDDSITGFAGDIARFRDCPGNISTLSIDDLQANRGYVRGRASIPKDLEDHHGYKQIRLCPFSRERNIRRLRQVDMVGVLTNYSSADPKILAAFCAERGAVQGKGHRCLECQQVIDGDGYDLREHVANDHLGIVVFCPYCGRPFQRPAAYSWHVRSGRCSKFSAFGPDHRDAEFKDSQLEYWNSSGKGRKFLMPVVLNFRGERLRAYPNLRWKHQGDEALRNHVMAFPARCEFVDPVASDSDASDE